MSWLRVLVAASCATSLVYCSPSFNALDDSLEPPVGRDAAETRTDASGPNANDAGADAAPADTGTDDAATNDARASCPSTDSEILGERWGAGVGNGTNQWEYDQGVVVGMRHGLTTTGTQSRRREFVLDDQCPLTVHMVLAAVDPRAAAVSLVSVRWTDDADEAFTIGMTADGLYTRIEQDCMATPCAAAAQSAQLHPNLPSEIALTIHPDRVSYALGTAVEGPRRGEWTLNRRSSRVAVSVGISTTGASGADVLYGALTTSWGP